MKQLPFYSPKWTRSFRELELTVKAIVCPAGKNFWCDSRHYIICYVCGMIRYMIRTQTVFRPKNYAWKVYTRERFYIIKKNRVVSYPIADMLRKPCLAAFTDPTFK